VPHFLWPLVCFRNRGNADFTPLAEKQALAAKLGAELVVVRDTPTRARALSLAGSIAEEHAVSPLLLD